MNKNSNRASFGFVNAARSAFRFLSDYGLQETKTTPTNVDYENSELGISIYHGRQSYEIGISIYRKGKKFSISMLTDVFCEDSGVTFRPLVALTRGEVYARTHELAIRARPCLVRCLSSVEDCFSLLEAVAKRNARLLESVTLGESVRPKADAAFRAKDYDAAAVLYESIEAQLSPSERERLRIAQSRR